MKRFCIVPLLLVLSGAAFAAAEGGAMGQPFNLPDSALTQRGRVVEVVATKEFTYVAVKQEEKRFWVVAPVTPVRPGDTIRYPEAPLMPSFHSNSLNRDFQPIMFVNRIIVIPGLP